MVYIGCILSHICGINQWWNMVNLFKKKFQREILKKNYFGFLLFEWFLNIGHRNHCQNPKNKVFVYHKCSILYHIWGSMLPRMWYTIPQMWIPILFKEPTVFPYYFGKALNFLIGLKNIVGILCIVTSIIRFFL